MTTTVPYLVDVLAETPKNGMSSRLTTCLRRRRRYEWQVSVRRPQAT